MIFLQVTEISPTVLRSTALGALTVFGAGALTFVPYIIDVSGVGVTGLNNYSFKCLLVLILFLINLMCSRV